MSVGRATDPVEAMAEDDYASPAEIFISRRAGSSRGGLAYHRFSTAAEAIDFAVEEFSSLRPDDLVMAVENKRFNLGALRALHPDALLRMPSAAAEPAE